MSCEILNGLGTECKTLRGGIDSVFFINTALTDADITYDLTNTDVIDNVNNVTNLYKYELKGTNSFDQVINSSSLSGSTLPFVNVNDFISCCVISSTSAIISRLLVGFYYSG